MTPLRLHDSLRRQKVPFEPLQPGKVGMYVCGPTPYAPAHIGHAYSAICFDTVRRALTFLGYDVRYIRNITDVEDKIINAANKAGVEWSVLAERYTDEYVRDMARFNVLPPDEAPKVSTHIAEIITLIERLIANGVAYVVDGDVNYEVAKFPTYGKLSGMSVDDLRAGGSDRVAVDERKRAPADFALWKSAKPGEPSWPSPWGDGRPGWHIECSAMTEAHLGTTFDIHGGGKDLIFPHHENEVAQSQGAHGTDTFARYWLHNGFVNFDGEKMSKSLGNTRSAQEIADAVGGEATRFFFVEHHYRSPVEFEIETIRDADHQVVDVRFHSLEAADGRLEKFYVTLQRLDAFVAGNDGGDGAVLPEAEKLMTAARDALSDDFNAPVVMAALHEANRFANKLLDEGKGIDKAVRRRTLARLAKDLRIVGGTLGILNTIPSHYLAERRARMVKRKGIDIADVERRLGERTAARAAKDFTAADEIRKGLLASGVELLDTPQGTDWRVQDDAG